MYGRKLFLFFGMSAANAAIVYPAYRMGQQNHDYYRRLSEQEQREIYERCPSQKHLNSNDAMSAIQERLLLTNPADNTGAPRTPYQFKR